MSVALSFYASSKTAHPQYLVAGEAGTGNVIEAVRHARQVNAQIARASTLSEIELYSMAKELSAPVELLRECAKLKRLPVVMFSAGGIATPADAALMMKLGMDGVFVYVSDLFSEGHATHTIVTLQWIWYLQVGEPREARSRGCPRDDSLPRPG